MTQRLADLPDQAGRVAIVTGANSGLGYVTARELARRGAHVVLACRDETRGNAALERLRNDRLTGRVELRLLDLASLTSVRTFSAAIRADFAAVDLLINNAGIMAVPYSLTVDGFERQFATNHLGHFALTGRLLPLLIDQPAARIVTVSSLGHRAGEIRFDDLESSAHYRRWRAYFQSKLANLLFAFELNRRLSAVGAPLLSVAAHPGLSSTNLVAAGADGNALKERVSRTGMRLIGQSDEDGALPQLWAAAGPDVAGGDYLGPDRFGETRGAPILVEASRRANDQADAARLWAVSEELTGVHFDSLDG